MIRFVRASLAGCLLFSLPASADTVSLGSGPGGQSSTTRIGPSFPCPASRDPLAQLICDSSELSRVDLTFVQTYQAYRQQVGPEGQKALRAESVEFARSVRAACGIAEAQAKANAPMPPPAPPDAARCVGQSYERQRSIWSARLSGPAAQEAWRPLDQHIGLQRNLQLLNLMPANDAIDGVFGPDTRAAILAFQQAMGLPTTGLLGDSDAIALQREVSARTAGPNRAAVAPVPPGSASRTSWEAFQGEALGVGVRAAISLTESACAISLDVHNPEALARAARRYGEQSGNDPSGEDEAHVFKTAIAFLTTQVAAKAVRAVYSDQPQVDHCVFSVAAFTQDVYGRDVRQPLFNFGFERATYAKIVWDRFNPANLPKIVATFSYGAYAQERLRELDNAAAPKAGPALPPAVPAQADPTHSAALPSELAQPSAD